MMLCYRQSVCVLAMAMLVSLRAGAEVPVNDACANATVLSAGVTEGSNVEATGEGDLFGDCNQPVSNDLWYAVTCPANHYVDLTVTPDGFFAALAVYDGCGGQAIACDQPNGNPQPAYVRVLNSSAQERTYYVRVAGYFQFNVGNFSIEAVFEPIVIPENDACANAISLGLGTASGDLTFASGEAVNTCPLQETVSSPDVWYRVQVPAKKAISILSEAGGFSSTVNLYSACGTDALYCQGGNANRVTRSNASDTVEELLLRVGSSSNEVGTFDVTLTLHDIPANDTCDTAAPLSEGTIAASNAYATSGPLNQCLNSDVADVWYVVSVPAWEAAALTVTSDLAGYIVSAYDRCGGTSLGCDGVFYPNEVATISVPNRSREAVEILVRIATYGYSPGSTFSLTLAFSEVQANAVTIADAGLEAALRDALAQPEGPLLDIPLSALTSLDASGRSIADLSGLEYCTGLTTLTLSNNQIEALGALKGLTELSVLALDGNRICALGALVENGGLAAGDSVSLGGNGLTSVACGTEIPALVSRGVVVDSGGACDSGGAEDCNVIAEGEGAAEGEGVAEGEGAADGEGTVEGEGEGGGFSQPASADQDNNGAVDFTELLRVIQFYNAAEFGCGFGTEDGYAPDSLERACIPHTSDYNPQDWIVSLSELLRLVQIYNSGSYVFCPELVTEDGFCPGL